MGRLLVMVVLIGSMNSSRCDEAVQREFFESYVRPLLISRCLECHSHDHEISGGLSLDSRSEMLQGGDSGPAFDNNDWSNSLVWKAVNYRDTNLQMPPDGKLTEREIEVLRKWFETGAFDPRQPVGVKRSTTTGLSLENAKSHWAYQPVNHGSTPPNVPFAGNGIDAFLAEQQKAINVVPSHVVSQGIAKQRLYLDLTGMRPDPHERSDIDRDSSGGQDDYEQLVDQLLASPKFGEHFARHWMDIVRFAESITLRGFVLPDAWRYREYLIDSFNGDTPIDQFIREQIAGDLMNASDVVVRQKQWTATTMLTLGDTNLEEQDKKQLEMDYIDEQLDVLGKALLGQTLGCARCHDHKFDPIPTKDYYALAGILKSSIGMEHSNVSAWIRMPLPLDPQTEASYERAEQEVSDIKSKLNEWKKHLANMDKGSMIKKRSQLSGIVVDDIDAVRKGEWKASTSVPAYVGDGYLHDQHQSEGLLSVSFVPGELPPGRYTVRISYAAAENRATNTMIRVYSADGEDVRRINQRIPPKDDGFWQSIGDYLFEQGGRSEVVITNEGADGHVIADAVQFLQVTEQEQQNPPSLVETKSVKEIQAMVSELEKQLGEANKIVASRPMVMSLKAVKTPKDIPVHVRGSVHQLGEVVPRGFLQCVTIDELPTIAPTSNGRLELADWLVSQKNPLTARVYVNRIWAHLMGDGLVRTVDNFGTTGETPSNRSLLDWLTVRFLENQWSTKWLVREIVMSDAYRRCNDVTENQTQNDPENRTFAHRPLRRISPEAMRDLLLQASGELSTNRKPEANFGSAVKEDYRYGHDSRWRSVYGPWFRNSLPELFSEFDGPNPSFSIGQRTQSTIAPQALLLLNSPWIEARCHAIAKRLTTNVEPKARRILFVYESLLGRHPTDEETVFAAAIVEGESVLEYSALARHLIGSLDFRFAE